MDQLSRRNELWAPRISFKNTAVFFAGTISLFLASVFLSFYRLYPGLLGVGFFAGVGIYLLIQVLAIGSGYAVTKEGVVARRMYKARTFRWENITRAVLVNEAQAMTRCMTYPNPPGEERISRIQAVHRLEQLVEYCTVNLRFSKKTASDFSGETDKNGITGRFFIELVTKDQKIYLLTPADPDGFLAAIEAAGISRQDEKS